MFWIKIKHPQCCRPLLFTSIPRVCCDLSGETWRHWAAGLAHAPLLAGTLPCGIPFSRLVLLHVMTYIRTHVAKIIKIRSRKNLGNPYCNEGSEKLPFSAKEKIPPRDPLPRVATVLLAWAIALAAENICNKHERSGHPDSSR